MRILTIPLLMLDVILPGGLSLIFPGVSEDRWLTLISDIITLIALIYIGRQFSKYQISLRFRVKEIQLHGGADLQLCREKGGNPQQQRRYHQKRP